MAEPLALPAVKGIETVVLFVTVAVPSVGAAGAAAAEGVIELEAEDEELAPTPLVAVIVKVYAWP
jgi:hypothetical protein